MHATSQSVYEGGFTNPVLDAQEIFRDVMDGFANPGRIVDLGKQAHAPAPLPVASATILAALADYDTAVWFEEKDIQDAGAWLAFHTGAPVVDDPGSAVFAVLVSGGSTESWSRLATGTSSYPDRSATILLPIASLTDGPALQLTGPGIETICTIAPSGLPDGLMTTMAGNRSKFPLGFDVVLICGSQMLALPRTTRIAETY